MPTADSSSSPAGPIVAALGLVSAIAVACALVATGHRLPAVTLLLATDVAVVLLIARRPRVPAFRPRRRGSVAPAPVGNDALFQPLFAHTPLPTWLVNAETLAVLAANPAAVTVYASGGGLSHRHLTDLFDRPDGTSMRSAFTTAGATDEWQCAGRSGEQDIEASWTPVSVGGQPAVLLTTRDVTAKRRAASHVRLLESVAINATDGVVVCSVRPDATGTVPILYVNEAYTRMMGYSAAELVGSSPERLFSSANDPALGKRISAAVATGSPLREEVVLRRKDRSRLWVELSLVPVRDESGVCTHIVGMQRDITERRAARQAREAEEARVRSLVEHVSDIITVYEPDWTVRYESPSLERVLGYRPEEIVGGTVDAYVHPDDLERVRAAIRVNAGEGGPHEPIEVRLRHKDGSWRHFEVIANDRTADPDVAGIVVTSRDITERKRHEEELLQQAFFDTLTGIPNRAAFMRRLHEAAEQAAIDNDALAVLFIDLDRFKIVNDSLGHAAGDELLVEASRRLAGCVRESDMLARLGGDEFTILMDRGDAIHCETVAARIVEEMSRPVIVRDREVRVGASVGIALGTADELEPDDLLRRADLALYEAKAEGRGRFAVYDPAMHERMMRLLEMENDLRHALERDELRVLYQPEVDLRSGRVVGVEALVRWQHPVLGLISPTEFIPLAEETGMIISIGEWVLERACRDAVSWQGVSPVGEALTLSVNLSARQVHMPDLPGRIAAILDDTGLDPSSLHLEVTETTLVEDTERSVLTLHGLRTLGVRLSVDDFGTGYSSLGYLRRFPFDTLKVDRSFVSALTYDEGAVAIVRAIAALAGSLGMEVTAEGIETAEQRDAARNLGCDWGQGYLFARPLPADEITCMMRDRIEYDPGLLPELTHKMAVGF